MKEVKEPKNGTPQRLKCVTVQKEPDPAADDRMRSKKDSTVLSCIGPAARKKLRESGKRRFVKEILSPSGV